MRRRSGYIGNASGGVAEWFRQGPAKPCTAVRFRSPPLAVNPLESWITEVLSRDLVAIRSSGYREASSEAGHRVWIDCRTSGALAQRESTCSTSKGSLVQSQHAPPDNSETPVA